MLDPLVDRRELGPAYCLLFPYQSLEIMKLHEVLSIFKDDFPDIRHNSLSCISSFSRLCATNMCAQFSGHIPIVLILEYKLF